MPGNDICVTWRDAERNALRGILVSQLPSPTSSSSTTSKLSLMLLSTRMQQGHQNCHHYHYQLSSTLWSSWKNQHVTTLKEKRPCQETSESCLLRFSPQLSSPSPSSYWYFRFDIIHVAKYHRFDLFSLFVFWMRRSWFCHKLFVCFRKKFRPQTDQHQDQQPHVMFIHPQKSVRSGSSLSLLLLLTEYLWQRKQQGDILGLQNHNHQHGSF